MSEKSVKVSDIMSGKKTGQSIDSKVVRRFIKRGSGSVATPVDFLDLGSRAAVDQALSRLVRQGALRRVSRGVYNYPKMSRLLGELSPSPEEVARALARQGLQRIIPSGAYAANLLGLSEQVPARIEYLTDGSSRKVMIRNLPVVLKRTTPRQMATANRTSGNVAQALRFLRKDQVDETIIKKLRTRLSKDDKEQLLKDIPLVPAWIGEIFRQVAETA